MTVEFRGVSTASLGGMLKGYGVMAGVDAEWPDARFWWTPAGALAAAVEELDDSETANPREVIQDVIFRLANWANNR